MGALKELEIGCAALLAQWEVGDWLPSEGAKGIVLWLLRNERLGEALHEANDLCGQFHTVSNELDEILHGVLGLPRD